ncbi:TRAP transporter small permease subunit [Aminiphilus sp.]|jgi:TRAP-type C4-dicarboxylate transport system permease small subunit|uniref:TRAP transporter small permease n=1 Tax=Aminiphilus sp. TaxID=1872488 RepID=UPI00261D4E96|nr:TRAP transporter small permease subunit [Aminiphilus sp.]
MTSSGRFFQCFLRAIEIAENLLCGLGLLIVTAMTFFQVLNRYWLHLEIMWLGDLSLYLFIPFVFLTIALTTREKGHTAVDVFGEKLFKEKPREFALYKIALQLASLGVLLLFAQPTYEFALASVRYPQYGTLVTWFNTSWLMQSLFVSVLLCIVHLLAVIARDTVEYRNRFVKPGGRSPS